MRNVYKVCSCFHWCLHENVYVHTVTAHILVYVVNVHMLVYGVGTGVLGTCWHVCV